MIRPHLEYEMQIWNQRLLGDIESLEKVQRRATQIQTKLSKLSYYQRLAELGLKSLKNRHYLSYSRESFKSRRRNDFAFLLQRDRTFLSIELRLVGTFYRQM